MKRTLSVLLAALTVLTASACSSAERAPRMPESSEEEISLERGSSSEVFAQPESPAVQETVFPAANESAEPESALSNKEEQEEAVSSSAPVVEPAVSSSAPAVNQTPEAVPLEPASSSSAPTVQPTAAAKPQEEQRATSPITAVEETRAVWISFLDFNTMLKGQTESQFRANIETAFSNVADSGLNTVIVQVRPYGDALYPSDYFPWSHTVTGTEGKNPGFDPLDIMVTSAHKHGLAIEAWVNPYRIRNANTNAPLDQNSQAAKWLNGAGDQVLSYQNGIYFNPGNAQARQLIVDGVTEIVKNYAVDGIHFDDYFYPTTDAAFDADTYASYQKQGGKLALADWRRENVNTLVRQVYSAIKSVDSGVRFGISPQGNNKNNYNTQYVDAKTWLSQKGYVDYICPQIYFGFKNSGQPYAQTVQEWSELIQVEGIDLWIGLSPYKLGLSDQWAGDGKDEWIGTTNMLERMVEEARDASGYGGFVLFRYDSLYKPAADVKQQVQKELANLTSILD